MKIMTNSFNIDHIKEVSELKLLNKLYVYAFLEPNELKDMYYVKLNIKYQDLNIKIINEWISDNIQDNFTFAYGRTCGSDKDNFWSTFKRNYDNQFWYFDNEVDAILFKLTYV